MKTELTIEQSQRLIELGVSADKASKEIATTIGEQEYSDPRHPILTLTDLLQIPPKTIYIDGTMLSLTITGCGMQWCVQYVGWYHATDFFIQDELVDALYELTIWLIEKNLYSYE